MAVYLPLLVPQTLDCQLMVNLVLFSLQDLALLVQAKMLISSCRKQLRVLGHYAIVQFDSNLIDA